tara:strand:- start:732 stop:1058 length:327 start_codon:yes stop_codon:yes gene_type:complete
MFLFVGTVCWFLYVGHCVYQNDKITKRCKEYIAADCEKINHQSAEKHQSILNNMKLYERTIAFEKMQTEITDELMVSARKNTQHTQDIQTSLDELVIPLVKLPEVISS